MRTSRYQKSGQEKGTQSAVWVSLSRLGSGISSSPRPPGNGSEPDERTGRIGRSTRSPILRISGKPFLRIFPATPLRVTPGRR
ncbi:MAG: hypothetical protein MZV64_13350 [Ignavibacteriales bacterium]|nr:hypothetical protein [Ignavibacteriales bacterium]